MLDDFFTRALLAGIGVAFVAGPLGCFIVWKRLAYFGDTLSHAALLGVALGFLLEINLTLSVFAVSALVAITLVFLQHRVAVSSDSILGIIAHSALAIGLVALAFMTWIRFDIMGLLFGDILAVSKFDLAIIWFGGAIILLILALIWRPLFASTVSRELAKAEGINPDRAELIFMLLMASVIAVALKVLGALLITALLIIPAAAARRFSNGPEQMLIIAAIIGAISAISGLMGSLHWDTPSGPSIVLSAFFIFILSVTPIAKLIQNLGSKQKVVKG